MRQSVGERDNTSQAIIWNSVSGVFAVEKLKTGVIGAGVFGNYHAQKTAASARTKFSGIFDHDHERAGRIASTYGTAAHREIDVLLDASDAVIVAVPATHHEEVARRALEAGCHVLVEKPLALDAEAARELADKAHGRDLILQVGHQERFVARAMGIFDIEETPLVMESVRASPPAADGRAGDVSVIWDLMIHDLDLAACMISRQFDDVKAHGEIIHTEHIDRAEAEFHYKNGAVARLTSSRASQQRIRTMRIAYPSGEIIVDFLARTLSNTTPFDVRIDIAADLPDPLGMADEGFFAACLGETESPVPARGAVAAVSMAQQAEACILSGLVTA